MDKALETLVGTAPSAVAVIIVVIVFLKHLAARDQLLRDLHIEHESSREASRLVIKENTEILGEHIQLGREMSDVLREVSKNIQNCQAIRQEWENHRRKQA